MPDATEWLVEYFDSDTGTNYEHIEERDDAIAYLRQLVGQGRAATLYQRVPFEVQIGVTVKAPRKRRKSPSPADKPGSDTPTGPGNGEAGDHSSNAGGMVPGGAHNPAVAGSIPAPATFPWTCEARFDGDPVCPARTDLDPATSGYFCAFHLALVPLAFRLEMHRIHASRNRPVRVAHVG
jgi:hypothetical protein